MTKQEITITLPTELIEKIQKLVGVFETTQSENIEHLLMAGLKEVGENKAFVWLLNHNKETHKKYMKEVKRNFKLEQLLKITNNE